MSKNNPTAEEAIEANRRAKAAKIHTALKAEGITDLGQFTPEFLAQLAGYDSIGAETHGYLKELMETD